MRKAFEALVEESEEDNDDTLSPFKVQPKRPLRRRALWIGGGVLGVAALALAAFLIWLPTPPPDLPPNPPLLTVSTTPVGALVSLNGDSLGTTPFMGLALSVTNSPATMATVYCGVLCRFMKC